jgi:hypothetical protein
MSFYHQNVKENNKRKILLARAKKKFNIERIDVLRPKKNDG